MVKMKQWVPIDGTRWRNEFVNDHESRGACIHCGVAHDGVMAPFPELPNTAGLDSLLGRRLGGPGFLLHQTRNGICSQYMRIRMPCKRFSARLTSAD